MADYPADLKYTTEHEWIDGGSPAAVGVTPYAAEALGDVVFVELPKVGATIEHGTVVGEIESTKSVSELYSPVSGTVVEVNEEVVADPALVNSDAFAAWLFKVDVTAEGELLTAEEYAGHAGG
ncbi:glycine cleavage system protein GcvH [Myceligenerans crystallogenes]|uniref:Glycine cleavage system H protein n=1 Tax=Myceligenerans crystallogenes TaxID=316335 RepID=A0ABN2NFM4_9MICO